jgi:hypothetical protein
MALGHVREEDSVPVVMEMKWDGITPDQYNELRDQVRWEEEVPAGGMFHVSWFSDNALHVVDVWESPEGFEAFSNERLLPAVQAAGIQSQPEVAIHQAHRVLDQVHKDRW